MYISRAARINVVVCNVIRVRPAARARSFAGGHQLLPHARPAHLGIDAQHPDVRLVGRERPGVLAGPPVELERGGADDPIAVHGDEDRGPRRPPRDVGDLLEVRVGGRSSEKNSRYAFAVTTPVSGVLLGSRFADLDGHRIRLLPA